MTIHSIGKKCKRSCNKTKQLETLDETLDPLYIHTPNKLSKAQNSAL